jgi:toxin YoeB
VKITFTPNGWDDYVSWSGDRKILNRINRLITEASRDPGSGTGTGTGTGKPERLSGNLAGYWSRRIDQEHRLVYTAQDDALVIVQARYHY